ncbi:membrane protein [Pectobacterium carotovorum subsp. carotovorum]|nr:membrane protein [Pectobacterium carotovorum subsp. carotovorum]
MLGGESVVVKINRPLFFIYSIFIFFLSCWGGWFSLNGYIDFFNLNNVVSFSWKLGVIIFLVPIVFQFSYFGFFSAIKNRPIKMNNKISNLLVIFAVSGAAVSLFSSMYISYSLNEQGYKICSKNSWMAPNKYVKDVSLCD